jgi:hypothetical protein
MSLAPEARMAPPNRRRPGSQMPGQTPSSNPARPLLIPSDPLPGWKALVQAIALLGIPIALLLLAKVVLRRFFPGLGY